MGLVQLSAPGAEALGLDEAKAHLRIDGGTEDALVQSLILTSRLHIEAALGLALVTQNWRLTLDAWPKEGVVKLPIAPVRAVTEIRVLGADGGATVIDGATYALDSSGRPARTRWTPAFPAPVRSRGRRR